MDTRFLTSDWFVERVQLAALVLGPLLFWGTHAGATWALAWLVVPAACAALPWDKARDVGRLAVVAVPMASADARLLVVGAVQRLVLYGLGRAYPGDEHQARLALTLVVLAALVAGHYVQ